MILITWRVYLRDAWYNVHNKGNSLKYFEDIHTHILNVNKCVVNFKIKSSTDHYH